MAAPTNQSEYWQPPHKDRSLLDRPLASASDYKLRMASGWTVTDGTYPPVTEDRRTNRNVPYPSYIDQAYRATSEVNIYPPNGPALWSADESHQESIYEQTEQQTEKRGEDVYGEFKTKPWGLWPLWVEDQWGCDYVLLVWYADSSTANPELFDNVTMATIYDPRRDPVADAEGYHGPISQRRARLEQQIRKFFVRAGFETDKLVFADGYCAPMPLDEATSGERCFASTKEIIDCLISYYQDAADGNTQDLSHGFWNLSQWVNPYQYRIEMAGINAWVLMATFDYNARVTVECIEPDFKSDVVADGKHHIIKPFSLAGPYEAPEMATDDYLLRSKSTT
ncbi:hypothetical protein Daesc_009790 [Daldinia eschscholtzii]|uniref:Amine oxidase n=1 Tax=Daldinia eschscholtzii TaxID=292717 RepID=A0AAX6MBA4_9PEZI